MARYRSLNRKTLHFTTSNVKFIFRIQQISLIFIKIVLLLHLVIEAWMVSVVIVH